MVDDPYDYGAIAAANALSDVYAMGGKPVLALNVAALPPDLPLEISTEIIRGGAEKALEAGVVIAGGHTVQDKEPKYGLVVVGFVDSRKIITKHGAQPGDALVLTKPLGFGVTTTALKRQEAEAADINEVVDWMKKLNQQASVLAVEASVHGGTDITGFSLLGHAHELAAASRVGLTFEFDRIPFVSCARKYAERGTFPGGAHDNKAYYEKFIHFSSNVDDASRMLLFDPQTSGGLLLAVPEDKLEKFLKKAGESDQPAWVIGRVKRTKSIEVI